MGQKDSKRISSRKHRSSGPEVQPVQGGIAGSYRNTPVQAVHPYQGATASDPKSADREVPFNKDTTDPDSELTVKADPEPATPIQVVPTGQNSTEPEALGQAVTTGKDSTEPEPEAPDQPSPSIQATDITGSDSLGPIQSDQTKEDNTQSSLNPCVGDSTEDDILSQSNRSIAEESTPTMSRAKLTKPAPEFSGTAVVNGEFKTISLSDYKGKYVVLFFYPLDFTFVCPTEIIAFSDRVEEFRAIDCEVIACSTDSQFSHLAWINTPRKQGGLGEMKIPLLADKTMDITKTYGVYKEDDGVSFRGLFIIDGRGLLRQITVNDLPVGRSVDETLRLVQAFQFTDKHGEVCPAGWKPGKATIVPKVEESKEFFQQNA